MPDQNKPDRDLEMFEALLDSFILPDGRPLRSLLASDEPGSISLRSVYAGIEQDDIDLTIQAKFSAVKELAISKGWNWGRVTADLFLQELLIRQASLEAMLRKQDKASDSTLY
jgi:hypothetical protein